LFTKCDWTLYKASITPTQIFNVNKKRHYTHTNEEVSSKSITTLASAVQESGAVDPVAKLQKEAVHAISVGDDGFSAMKKHTIIKIFREDYVSVQWLIKQLQG
jgi:hypothetical protein